MSERPHVRLALVAALLSALALAACGGGGGEPTGAPGLGSVSAGSVALLSSCADWRRGSIDERLATIDQVRNQVEVEGGSPSLSDEDAYEFFQRSCEPEYAGSFRLYKLFNRGASFSPLTD